MDLDQRVTIVFTVMGIFAGVISYYLSSPTILAIVSPLPLYVVTVSIITKLVKDKKIKQMVYNSAVTFVLVWLLVWIFLYNL